MARNYQCLLCGHITRTGQGLRPHLRKVHGKRGTIGKGKNRNWKYTNKAPTNKKKNKEPKESMAKVKLKRLLDRIIKVKNNIAKERNKLREHYDELTDVLESLDGGIESLNTAKREIEHALDEMSQYL